MEEDIKLIGNMIFDIEMTNSDYKYCGDNECWLSEKHIKAIQNIIAELDRLRGIEKDSIRKSLVRIKLEKAKEKLEKSQQTYADTSDKKNWMALDLGIDTGEVNALKELLEEEENMNLVAYFVVRQKAH